MNRVFLFLAIVLCGTFAMAQETSYNQVVWLNGKVMYASPIPMIDSITFTAEAVEQDTLHLLLPRSIVRVVYDTVVVRDTVYIYKCNEGNDDVEAFFAVSDGKQVMFSKGNLQYRASTQTWRFAEHQYDCIGSGNAKTSAWYDGWIDLFGWGTGDQPTQTSMNRYYYTSFTDWGINPIGNDTANTWRTLTNDEWNYLFRGRENAKKLFGFCTVNDRNGLVVLPDNWVKPNDVTFVPSVGKGLTDRGDDFYDANADIYSHNTYTLAEWEKMEKAGAVFLPAASCRGDGVDPMDVSTIGGYWSSSTSADDFEGKAYYIHFDSAHFQSSIYWFRYLGFSVRLVKDY